MQKANVLDDLCEARLHQHDEVNECLHYDDTLEQLKIVLDQEHHYLLLLLEQEMSQSLTKAIKYAYKLGFRDATALLERR